MHIIIVLAALMLAVGFLGLFLNRFVNEGKKEYKPRLSDETLAEWESAAKKYDAAGKKEESYALSEAWRAMRNAATKAEACMPSLMRVPVKCASLDEYKSFDAAGWARAGGLDLDEVQSWLNMSDKAVGTWAELRQDIDEACAMAVDEENERTRDACWGILDGILSRLSGDLSVEYSYSEGDRKYRSVQVLGRPWLRGVLGIVDDRDDPLNQELAARHAFLKSAGYRCRRCGRSPLSGARLKVCASPMGNECLCDNCRGSEA